MNVIFRQNTVIWDNPQTIPRTFPLTLHAGDFQENRMMKCKYMTIKLYKGDAGNSYDAEYVILFGLIFQF